MRDYFPRRAQRLASRFANSRYTGQVLRALRVLSWKSSPDKDAKVSHNGTTLTTKKRSAENPRVVLVVPLCETKKFRRVGGAREGVTPRDTLSIHPSILQRIGAARFQEIVAQLPQS